MILRHSQICKCCKAGGSKENKKVGKRKAGKSLNTARAVLSKFTNISQPSSFSTPSFHQLHYIPEYRVAKSGYLFQLVGLLCGNHKKSNIRFWGPRIFKSIT